MCPSKKPSSNHQPDQSAKRYGSIARPGADHALKLKRHAIPKPRSPFATNFEAVRLQPTDEVNGVNHKGGKKKDKSSGFSLWIFGGERRKKTSELGDLAPARIGEGFSAAPLSATCNLLVPVSNRGPFLRRWMFRGGCTVRASKTLPPPERTR